MQILDVCCGARMMWADKANPAAVFGDLRKTTVCVPDSSHRADGTRTIKIEPTVQYDFRALPFADASFDLVVFDPPHLIRAGDKSWLAVKYGTLVFKWNETQIPVREVLALCDRAPLFGHLTGHKNKTHWLVFAGSRA